MRFGYIDLQKTTFLKTFDIIGYHKMTQITDTQMVSQLQ